MRLCAFFLCTPLCVLHMYACKRKKREISTFRWINFCLRLRLCSKVASFALVRNTWNVLKFYYFGYILNLYLLFVFYFVFVRNNEKVKRISRIQRTLVKLKNFFRLVNIVNLTKLFRIVFLFGTCNSNLAVNPIFIYFWFVTYWKLLLAYIKNLIEWKFHKEHEIFSRNWISLDQHFRISELFSRFFT